MGGTVMTAKNHSLTLESRSALNITSVDDVLSFDESLVSLAVGDTVLNISGNGLSIKNLSLENGNITVNGSISAIVYFDDSPKKKRFSLFNR